MSIEIPVRPEELLLNLIEDERAVPCQAYRPCPIPAAWAWRCPRCSYDHQFCDAHRRSLDEDLAKPNGHVHCANDGTHLNTCGEPLPHPVPWRLL